MCTRTSGKILYEGTVKQTTGCPKSSFLYFISLYFSTIGLGKQIISTKVVSFNIVHYFHSFVPSFDSNIRSVSFRAKGARARVYVPVTYFFNIGDELLLNFGAKSQR